MRYEKRRQKDIVSLLSYLQDPKCIKMNRRPPFHLTKEEEMIKTAERIFHRLYPNYNEELQSDTMDEEDKETEFRNNKNDFLSL